jgi:hypothetical protein
MTPLDCLLLIGALTFVFVRIMRGMGLWPMAPDQQQNH